MSVQKSHFGIPNMERYVERTLWTSATFVTANMIASMFFSNQSLMNRTVFSVLQSGTFIYLFESTYVENKFKGYKESFDGETAHKLIDYALFFFLTTAPILLARGITTWLFQPLSSNEGFQIGIYNYAAGGVGALVYEKIFKTETEPEPPPVRSSAPIIPPHRRRDPLETPGKLKPHNSL